MRAHARRADDIMTAIRIAEEFDVDLVLDHWPEVAKIADLLQKYNYPTVVGPSLINRAKVELRKTFETRVFSQAGLKVA